MSADPCFVCLEPCDAPSRCRCALPAHSECLQNWLDVRARNGLPLQCSVCTAPYRGVSVVSVTKRRLVRPTALVLASGLFATTLAVCLLLQLHAFSAGFYMPTSIQLAAALAILVETVAGVAVCVTSARAARRARFQCFRQEVNVSVQVL